MRVGGNDGLRLSRAAFAVILKFSELTRILRTVWDEVELVCMGIDQDVKGPARLNHLAKELRDSKPQEFEVLCKQWEQASQIRKWTQEMKKDLSEALKKECTDQLIAEINEKMKKEKEEKENQPADEESKDDKNADKDDAERDSDKPDGEPAATDSKESTDEKEKASANKSESQTEDPLKENESKLEGEAVRDAEN